MPPHVYNWGGTFHFGYRRLLALVTTRNKVPSFTQYEGKNEKTPTLQRAVSTIYIQGFNKESSLSLFISLVEKKHGPADLDNSRE